MPTSQIYEKMRYFKFYKNVIKLDTCGTSRDVEKKTEKLNAINGL